MLMSHAVEQMSAALVYLPPAAAEAGASLDAAEWPSFNESCYLATFSVQ